MRRQHEDTVLPELYGHRCSEFVAVQGEARFDGPLYIRLNGVWHRFYLDAGLLFWEEGFAPEPDDLLPGDAYIDLAQALNIRDRVLEQVRMHDSVLTVCFETGALLELRCRPDEEGPTLVRLIAATAAGVER